MTTIQRAAARQVLVAVAAVALAACSSGRDPSAAPPRSGNATFRGAVASTASGLTVGGVTFRTTGALLYVPDDSAAPILLESEDAVKGRLDDGMVVTVRGTVDDNGGTGEAAEIEYHDLMEAAIDDKGPGRIRVLGEDLSLDDSTEIVDRHGNALTPDDLGIGDRVEISGHGDGHGGARATYVRVRDDVDPSADHELKGWVIAISGPVLDLAFTKDGPLAVRVDLSGIASPPAIAVGDFVEVAFSEANPDGNGDGILDAVAIHLEDPFEPEPEDEVEVEGIVTAVGVGGFMVGDVLVIPNPDATFLGGTPDDIVVGVKVEAEGLMGDDGALHAEKVKFQASARIDANLEAKDPAAATLTLLGITVHYTPSTELRGFASVDDLTAGSRLEVRGYPTIDGMGLNATRIERLSSSPNDRAFLRAVVTAKTPTTGLTMNGLPIDTSSASFKDHGGAELAPADFFAAITEGRTIVKVRWRPYPASTSEPVDEAELEN